MILFTYQYLASTQLNYCKTTYQFVFMFSLAVRCFLASKPSWSYNKYMTRESEIDTPVITCRKLKVQRV